MGEEPDATDLSQVLAAWGGSRVLRPLPGGHRNRAYLVRGDMPDGATRFPLFVVKTTARSEDVVA